MKGQTIFEGKSLKDVRQVIDNIGKQQTSFEKNLPKIKTTKAFV
jgi:hypothetical protein